MMKKKSPDAGTGVNPEPLVAPTYTSKTLTHRFLIFDLENAAGCVMDENIRGVVQGLVLIIEVSVAVIAGMTAADLMGQLPSRLR
jgi:hypothetical protein